MIFGVVHVMGKLVTHHHRGQKACPLSVGGARNWEGFGGPAGFGWGANFGNMPFFGVLRATSENELTAGNPFINPCFELVNCVVGPPSVGIKLTCTYFIRENGKIFNFYSQN